MKEENEEKASFYGWKIKMPQDKEKDKKKGSYSMVTVFIGLLVLSFCFFMTIDAYRVINHPLFGFQSEDTQVAAWLQLGIGIFGTFGGLVLMIIGLIDYYKYGGG